MRRMKLLLCAIPVVSLTFAGCASSGGGGSLSDAMNKASDDNTGSRKVAPRREEERRYTNDEDDDDGTGSLLGAILSAALSEDENDRAVRQQRWEERHAYQPPKPSPPPLTLAEKLDRAAKADSTQKALGLRPNSWTTMTVTLSDTAGVDRSYKYRTQPSLDDGFTDPQWRLSEKREEPATKNPFLGVQIFSGTKASDQFANISGFSLVVADHGRFKHRSAGYIGGAAILANPYSETFGGTDGVYEMHLGYQHRWYSTPDYTWMGLFIFLNVEGRATFWAYKNPLHRDVFDADGYKVDEESVSSDGLFGVAGAFGLGCSVVQTQHAKFSVEAGLYLGVNGLSTMEGFDNDLMPGDAEARLTLEMAFGGVPKQIE